MSRKKISTTIYVTPEQSDKLRLLHERTKVPVAVYIREGIDLVLRHYVHLLPGQLPLDARGDARGDARSETREARAPKENGSTRSLERAAASEKTIGEKTNGAGHSDKSDKEKDDDSADPGGKGHGKKHGAASGA
jgi:hypothetical protein